MDPTQPPDELPPETPLPPATPLPDSTGYTPTPLTPLGGGYVPEPLPGFVPDPPDISGGTPPADAAPSYTPPVYSPPPVYTPPTYAPPPSLPGQGPGYPGQMPTYAPPPTGYSPPGYGFQSPPPPGYGGIGPYRSQRSTYLRLVGMLAGLLLVVGGVATYLVTKAVSSTGNITPGSSVQAGHGRTVFTDTFQDPGTGWSTDTLPSGTTFKYGTGGFVVVGFGDLQHFVDSPYSSTIAQIDVEATATQSANSPIKSGFGVVCHRGSGTDVLRYEFVVADTGTWYVQKRVGTADPNVEPTDVASGDSNDVPGATPLTVEATCATLDDGKTTRLLMFINGKRVLDQSDSAASALPGLGWRGGIDVDTSASAPSTVTFTNFVLRDAAG